MVTDVEKRTENNHLSTHEGIFKLVILGEIVQELPKDVLLYHSKNKSQIH